MPEKLTPQQVAKIISHFGQSKQLSKALRIFYQHEKTSHSSTALIGAFTKQDLLSAWKLLRQYAPAASPELACLAQAHYKKHSDYLRDNMRFAGFQSVDASAAKVVESAGMAGMWKESVDMYSQVAVYEEPAECAKFAIKAFAQLGDRKMTETLYEKVKCHASMARVLSELELVDFLGCVDNAQRSRELYAVLVERLSGDARFAVEQEMNERMMNKM